MWLWAAARFTAERVHSCPQVAVSSEMIIAILYTHEFPRWELDGFVVRHFYCRSLLPRTRSSRDACNLENCYIENWWKLVEIWLVFSKNELKRGGNQLEINTRSRHANYKTWTSFTVENWRKPGNRERCLNVSRGHAANIFVFMQIKSEQYLEWMKLKLWYKSSLTSKIVSSMEINFLTTVRVQMQLWT